MIKKIKYTLLFILLSCLGFSQINPVKFGFWTLTNVNGEVNINGLYREQERVLKSGVIDYPKNMQFAGGLLLRTNSYIWHPSFLKLGIDLDYNPEKRQDSYLITPDRSEVRSIKSLKINGTFFDKKIITINTFLNLDESFRNSENLNNIETIGKKYGGSLQYKNKIIPVSINANHHNWEQIEHNSGRTYTNEQTILKARASRRNSRGDKHELSYSINDYTRIDANLFKIHNTIGDLSLNNNIFFDKSKKYSLSSRINNFSQKGDNDFNRFQVIENLRFKLPQNFDLTSNYLYYNTQQNLQQYDQHSIKSRLSHQLYSSLNSSVIYEYSILNRDEFQETNNKLGVDFNYTKEIPTGKLNVSYKYYTQIQASENESKTLLIVNEEHVLSDVEITLLEKPYADDLSIVVTDLTGTIIYQENLDYIIISRNDFYQIERLPGGQIADGSAVYVDYLVTIPGSYDYQLNFQTFSIRVSLFKRFVELYYNINKQDYINQEKTDFLVLNYFTQNIVGIRLNKGPASAGFEYDNNESSILPYELKRVYVQLQGSIKSKFLYSINGNMRDYYMINDRERLIYYDVTGRLAYKFSNRTKLNVDVSYRNQQGQGIDLNLFTNGYELTTQYRKIYFSIGAEIYRRNYLDEIVNYLGADFKIARKF